MSNTDNSEWALSYILIWDSHLTNEEIKSVSSSLNTFIKTGVLPKFNSLYPSVTVNLNDFQPIMPNKDKYQYLNLTDIQKKMLL